MKGKASSALAQRYESGGSTIKYFALMSEVQLIEKKVPEINIKGLSTTLVKTYLPQEIQGIDNPKRSDRFQKPANSTGYTNRPG